MTVLSSIMGFALPALLPRKYTHYASVLLFVYFGVKLLKDASEMEGSGPSEELQEVEEELIHKKEGDDSLESAEVNGDAPRRSECHPRRAPVCTPARHRFRTPANQCRVRRHHSNAHAVIHLDISCRMGRQISGFR
jgi:putative Ca2+/H+ antiporter (TMEM165/GDT1 family)